MKLRHWEIAVLAATLLAIFITIALCVFRDGSQTTFSIEAVSPRPELSETPTSGEKLININTADAQELCSLPQIGEALAERIIAYRQKHGDFAHISDIIDVAGIGFATFDKIKSLITV